MEEIKNKSTFQIKKLLFVALAMFTLAGCDNQEFTNDSCIDDITEIMDKPITGEPCKDRDLGLLKHNATYTVDEQVLIDKPFYDTGKYLNSEEMNIANKLDLKKNQLGHTLIQMKKDFANSIFKDSLMYIAILIFIFQIMRKQRAQILSFLTFASITLFLLDMTVKTEFTTTPITVATIKASNYIARISQKNVIAKDLFTENSLKYYSKNEALIDTADFIKLMVCMNNSRKYEIENREYAMRYFNDKKAVSDFYNLKNEPYIFGEDSDDRRIRYNLSDGGFIQNINFARCGQVQFSSRKVSADTLELMKEIDFKILLHKAITSKDFESNLKVLRNNFDTKDKANGVLNYLSLSTYDDFIEILVLFSSEYKKGLMWGSVFTDYNLENTKVVNTDFSNLTKLQGYADSIYNNIVSSQCLLNGSMVNDTIKALNNFTPYNNYIGQYDCINFEDDELMSAVVTPYIYKNNKVLVDDLALTLQEDTLPIAKEATLDLIKHYEIVNNVFLSQIDTLFDYKKDLAFLYNQGAYASGKFNSYVNNKSSKYVRTKAELMDISRIDYSKSLPDFSFDSGDTAIKTNVYVVNAFIKSINDQIDSSLGAVTSNFTNSMLEYSMDNTGSNRDSGVQGDDNNMQNALSDYLENSSRIFSSVNKMVCAGDKSECDEVTKNFDGVHEFTELSNALIENGAKATVISTVTYIGLASVEGLINLKKKSKPIKGAKFGKTSKLRKGASVVGGAMSAAVSGGKKVAGSVAVLGFVSLVLGEVMNSLFELQNVILNWFAQGQLIYLIIMPLLLIAVHTIALTMNYSTESYTKTLTLATNIMITPILVGISVGVIVYFSNYMLLTVLNNIPNMSSLLLSQSGSVVGAIIDSLKTIFMILIVVFVSTFLIMKILISLTSQLVNVGMGQVFSSADRLIGKVQTAALATSAFGLMQNTGNKYANKIIHRVQKAGLGTTGLGKKRPNNQNK